MNQWFKDPPEYEPVKLSPRHGDGEDPKETRRNIDFQRMYVLLGAILATLGSIGLSFVGTVYNLAVKSRKVVHPFRG